LGYDHFAGLDHQRRSMRRVLIFDDDPSVIELLETALTEAGCAVMRAATLPQALAALAHGVDLAVIDMPMLNFTGIELGRLAAARGVKVLMIGCECSTLVPREKGQPSRREAHG
jgi:CheY-like chemotaxis protein